MEQDLEVAQAYVAAKNYEAAFNILHTLGKYLITIDFIFKYSNQFI